jgi:hypothetical protein
MASGISLRQLNDWKGEIGTLARNALYVSRSVCGRDGKEACKHFLILSAQSAAALTPQAKATRKVEPNPFFTHLMRTAQYKVQRMKDSSWRHMRRYYQFQARHFNLKDGQTHAYGNHPDRLSRVGNAGLAKRSWMWGLRDIGYTNGSRPLVGVADTSILLGETACGLILTNRLGYLLKILPAGWFETCQNNAAKKVIGQARIKMQKDLSMAFSGSGVPPQNTFAQAFMGAA